jgi:hypothetical protein
MMAIKRNLRSRYPRALGVLAMGCALVSSCARHSNEAAHDVPYYRQHRTERSVQVNDCVKDVHRSETDPDCLNALQAQSLEDIGRLSDLPPMGLMKESQTGQKSGNRQGK